MSNTHIKQLSSIIHDAAFTEGVLAHENHLAVGHNPYNPAAQIQEFMEWERGYLASIELV